MEYTLVDYCVVNRLCSINLPSLTYFWGSEVIFQLVVRSVAWFVFCCPSLLRCGCRHLKLACKKWAFPSPYVFRTPQVHVSLLSLFPFFSSVFLLLNFYVFELFIPISLFQPSCHRGHHWRRLAFVSTLVCMHLAWMFNFSNQCILMLSVAGLMTTVMASIDHRLWAAGSSSGCIGLVSALSVNVTNRLMPTCL